MEDRYLGLLGVGLILIGLIIVSIPTQSLNRELIKGKVKSVHEKNDYLIINIETNCSRTLILKKEEGLNKETIKNKEVIFAIPNKKELINSELIAIVN